ncbi:uncharacterized protein L969DRAFT_84793 [Mixia osmundae IAM 14324]|uniref:DNA/RNA-binding protein Kin17 WH-like domain-containing protein n=1 Tax=Mixia osmundae (strain CBS 9802 / IAM 14324 / JCM 22182 / KY 12970) TaxID=764103 RepID=G7DTA9_MIXOS|nr:uncharacterized protein L969DRAFT_84793 [Mixia osmundae IAM 14324]KEI42906.1 hypothetical protein L969DRAFT_84793 [Mixia osmundae IAM 14324]GAA93756.1 hypothetical protein E5Q_00402 [Mixia osmundae IAM 14324]
MPRAEKGSSKALANAMKSKGLQRLRWYCQVCEKQCRDANGFKCHTMSEGHLRMMLVVGENAGKHLDAYSQTFKSDFLRLLSNRWGTKRVRANQVYNEFIQDKHHTHMNSTRWVTLTEFIKSLGRQGVVKVDETEKGFYIAWIDNTPKTLSRQAATQSKERADMDDEQRQRKLIKEQIARAQAEVSAAPVASGSGSENSGSLSPSADSKEPAPPIQIKLDLPASAPVAPAAVAPIKINPLKVANPLKGASKPSIFKTGSATPASVSNKRPLSAMEQIVREEEERKRRRESRPMQIGRIAT